MPDPLLSILAGVWGGVIAWVVLRRLDRKASAKVQAAAGPIPPPAAALPPPEPPVADNIVALLATLNATLSPPAEEIGHPRELPDMTEFQAVVAAFRRTD